MKQRNRLSRPNGGGSCWRGFLIHAACGASLGSWRVEYWRRIRETLNATNKAIALCEAALAHERLQSGRRRSRGNRRADAPIHHNAKGIGVKVKVFISWSGTTSRELAEALHAWLPSVIQSIEPWMSSADIDKGARWSADIAEELEECSIGLICLTPDNLEAPWIMFEAGALSKALDRAFVCPYLFNLNHADLKGPLVQFQSSKAEKEDTKKLMHTGSTTPLAKMPYLRHKSTEHLRCGGQSSRVT
jgi:hypothetical protein